MSTLRHIPVGEHGVYQNSSLVVQLRAGNENLHLPFEMTEVRAKNVDLDFGDQSLYLHFAVCWRTMGQSQINLNFLKGLCVGKMEKKRIVLAPLVYLWGKGGL